MNKVQQNQFDRLMAKARELQTRQATIYNLCCDVADFAEKTLVEFFVKGTGAYREFNQFCVAVRNAAERRNPNVETDSEVNGND